MNNIKVKPCEYL